MTRRIVSWADYEGLIAALAEQVRVSAWSFDMVLCLSRGGLRLGDEFSRRFNCPLAVLATQSYDDISQQATQLKLAKHVTMTQEYLPAHLLLVDDMADTGHTLQAVLSYLKDHHPTVKECKTATLWLKERSVLKPDFYAEFVADNA